MSLQVIQSVKSKVRKGSSLSEALKELKISYTKWIHLRDAYGVKLALRRGKRAKVYTPERVTQVKKRINKGEFLRDVAKNMDMDPRNLARYCRNNGIQLFTKKALKENYQRRKKVGRGRGLGVRLQILGLINKGAKDAEIAKKLKVTRQYTNFVRQQAKDK